MYACDFSKRAVDMVKSNENYDETRCKAFVCDLTADKLTDNIPENSLDLVKYVHTSITHQCWQFVYVGFRNFCFLRDTSRENGNRH